MPKVSCVVLLAFTILIISYCPAENISLKELAAKVEKSENYYKNIEVNFSTNDAFDEKKHNSIQNRFAAMINIRNEDNILKDFICYESNSEFLKHKKNSGDELEEIPNAEQYVFENGILKTLELNYDKSIKSFVPSRAVIENKSADTLYQTHLIYRSPLIFTVLHNPIMETESSGLNKRSLLSETISRLGRLNEQIEKVNDFNVIRVDILQEYAKVPVRAVYFAVDYDYTPVRFCYLNGSLEKVITQYDILTLEKVGQIWFPASGKTTLAHSKPFLSFQTTGEIKINKGIRKDELRIKFPKGTEVTDKINNKTYTVE